MKIPETRNPKPETRFLFRLRHAGQLLIAFVVLPFLILAGLEFGLRAVGFGQSTEPFVKRTFDGNVFYVPNKAYFQQFYSLPVEQLVSWDEFEFQVPAKKAAGVCRLFVVGGSTANGQPPDAAYSFGRVLNAMLASQYPKVQFEFYCGAFPMSNSHVMWPVAKACAGLHPDVLISYMGDNEVNGPFGAGSKITDSFLWRIGFIRANVWLTNLRLVQLATGRSGGMLMKAQDFELFFPKLGPNAVKSLKAEGYLRRNLEDICRVQTRAGAKVILCTEGSNIRDWGPNVAEHRGDLAPADLQTWDGIYQAGIAKEAAGAYAEALAAYDQAAALDDTFADLRFRMGRCCWNLQQFEKAREHFIAAREWDYHQMRASIRVSDLIRKVAADASGRGVFLADCALALENSSPHGVVGKEFLYDNAHPTFEGNYEVARALFEQTVKALPAWVRAQGPQAPAVLSKEECVARLALTPWVREKHLDSVLQLLENEKAGPQMLGFAEVIEWWRQRQAEAREQAGPKGFEHTLDAYRAALEFKDDVCLRLRYVQGLLQTGNASEAVAQAEILAKAAPYRRGVLRWLGTARKDAGALDAALEALRSEVAYYPDDPGALFQFGLTLAAKQDLVGAVSAYRKSAAINPTDAAVQVSLGDALMRQQDFAGAATAFQSALKLNPDIQYIRPQLVRALVETGDLDAARKEAAGVELPKDLRDTLTTVNTAAP